MLVCARTTDDAVSGWPYDPEPGEVVARQIQAASDAPDGFAARRAELDEQIARAQADNQAAGDRLAVAQAEQREADKALRLARDAAANARIELTRIEERAHGLVAQRQQIERQIEEQLDIPASKKLEASGIRPEEKLPAEPQVEQRLERLKAERAKEKGKKKANGKS